MYKIEFTKLTEKKFFKLPLRDQERITSVLDRIRIRPFSHILRLVGHPYYRLRIGNYRLILDIQQEKLIILVIEIGQRKIIYDKIN